MDASRGTAGQRAGSRLTSSASTMEFSLNTGTFFRTRLRKRNPRAVYRCSEAVSPSDARTHSSPIVTSRFAEGGDARRATTGAKAPRSSIAHESLQDSDQGGNTMKWLARLLAASVLLPPPFAISHQSLTEVHAPA